jgi:serine protease AprX
MKAILLTHRSTEPARPTRRLTITVLLVCSLLAGSVAGPAFFDFTRAHASNNPKLADDLVTGDWARYESDSNKVPVIIQTPAAPSSSLKQNITANGGAVKKQFTNFNMLAVTLPQGALQAMAGRSDVSFISYDRMAQAKGHLETTTGADQARSYGTAQTGALDGTGIGIAILDSGLDLGHVAFVDATNTPRVVAQVDFTGENRTDDPYGHGTHVAATAAGSGVVSQGAYEGIAPNARLINVRVLNSQGQGRTADVINGIDWCISNKAAYNIRVMNLSLGTTAVASYTQDPLCQAVRRAVDAGIVVCVAAGNLGKDDQGNKIYGSIESPGIEPSAITVGAANTFGTDARTDDAVTSYSSCGPTRGYWTDASGVKHYDDLLKPDLIAPGNKIIEAEGHNNYLVSTYPSLDANVSANWKQEEMYLSGTSVASPVVAGAAALILQRNPQLTPNLVKAVLEYTADPLAGFNTYQQGAGLLNIEGAVRLAGLIRTDLSACTLGSPLLCSTCAAPTQATTIAGATFQWGGGIIEKWNFLYGSGLITQYQGIYGNGVLLTDGVLLSSGALLADGTLLTNGTLMSNGALFSDGTLLCNGTLLTNGTMLADGTLLADGTMLADGTLLSDCVISSSTSTTQCALAAMLGDYTTSMRIVTEPLPVYPSGLAATAASKSQINLSWVDNSVNESGYKIERSTNGTSYTQIATVGASVTSYASTGLSASTTYYYRVRAYNASGNSSYSNVVSAKTPSK